MTITILASWFVGFFLKKLKGGCESVRKLKKNQTGKEVGNEEVACVARTELL